ncbi:MULTISPECIES: hypothetical protein [unclassified Xanthomonas]|uniref:hypothetical protein n=1 Tax=unclassified Xanthomonas TaxID=2643310 RepID=UPI002A840604|nr:MULTISPECIES: hypothetical protein [unclassified Xanthomonas]MDY4298249.1 hypothetical protein [Xanthomonas sp. LF02-5]MDY4360040.1 hypothetical protein [Xanthomonas sp. LF04-12]
MRVEPSRRAVSLHAVASNAMANCMRQLAIASRCRMAVPPAVAGSDPARCLGLPRPPWGAVRMQVVGCSALNKDAPFAMRNPGWINTQAPWPR